jgi:hypothetical protein
MAAQNRKASMCSFSLALPNECRRRRALLRIPVKWSADSGDVGRCRSEATLAGFRMIQVDHIRQEAVL